MLLMCAALVHAAVGDGDQCGRRCRQLKDRTTQKLKEAFPEDITDYQQLRQEVVQGGGAQGPSGG